MFTISYCRKRLLWLRLRVAFVCEHKHRYLESSFMLYQFSNYSWAYDFPRQRFLMGFSAVEQVSNKTRQQLITSVRVVPLLKDGNVLLGSLDD